MPESSVPQANHALDGAQQVEFPGAQGWGLGHGGHDAGVDAHQDLGCLETEEDLVG